MSDLDNAIFESHGRVLLGTSPGSVLAPGLEDATDGRELVSLDGLQVGREPVLKLPSIDRSFAPPRRSLAAALADSSRSEPVMVDYTMTSPKIVSIADVLDDRVDPADIKGKVVLVGETYRSTDDREDTPISEGIPGVLIQAQAVDTHLSGRELRAPSDAATSTGVAVLAIGLGWLFTKKSHLWCTIGTLALLTGWVLVAVWGFGSKQWVLPVVAPLLTGFILVPSAVLPVLAAQNRAQLAWTRAQWGQMMPDGFVDRLEARRKEGLGSWSEFKAVVLFADLEGFSARSNQATSEELVDQLNAAFECLVEEIQAKNGVLLNFLGDGLCAMFEIDSGDPGGTMAKRRAIGAACSARNRVDALNENNRWGVRFGIASGDVTLALVGSENRRQLTIYGIAVNLAARLEQAIKLERGRTGCDSAWIMTAAEFEEACNQLGLRMISGDFTPKGWNAPIRYMLGPALTPP